MINFYKFKEALTQRIEDERKELELAIKSMNTFSVQLEQSQIKLLEEEIKKIKAGSKGNNGRDKINDLKNFCNNIKKATENVHSNIEQIEEQIKIIEEKIKKQEKIIISLELMKMDFHFRFMNKLEIKYAILYLQSLYLKINEQDARPYLYIRKDHNKEIIKGPAILDAPGSILIIYQNTELYNQIIIVYDELLSHYKELGKRYSSRTGFQRSFKYTDSACASSKVFTALQQEILQEKPPTTSLVAGDAKRHCISFNGAIIEGLPDDVKMDDPRVVEVIQTMTGSEITDRTSRAHTLFYYADQCLLTICSQEFEKNSVLNRYPHVPITFTHIAQYHVAWNNPYPGSPEVTVTVTLSVFALSTTFDVKGNKSDYLLAMGQHHMLERHANEGATFADIMRKFSQVRQRETTDLMPIARMEVQFGTSLNKKINSFVLKPFFCNILYYTPDLIHVSQFLLKSLEYFRNFLGTQIKKERKKYVKDTNCSLVKPKDVTLKRKQRDQKIVLDQLQIMKMNLNFGDNMRPLVIEFVMHYLQSLNIGIDAKKSMTYDAILEKGEKDRIKREPLKNICSVIIPKDHGLYSNIIKLHLTLRDSYKKTIADDWDREGNWSYREFVYTWKQLTTSCFQAFKENILIVENSHLMLKPKKADNVIIIGEHLENSQENVLLQIKNMIENRNGFHQELSPEQKSFFCSVDDFIIKASAQEFIERTVLLGTYAERKITALECITPVVSWSDHFVSLSLRIIGCHVSSISSKSEKELSLVKGDNNQLVEKSSSKKDAEERDELPSIATMHVNFELKSNEDSELFLSVSSCTISYETPVMIHKFMIQKDELAFSEKQKNLHAFSWRSSLFHSGKKNQELNNVQNVM